MARYSTVNTCKDNPVFIRYKVNGTWKEVFYQEPVSVRLESIGDSSTFSFFLGKSISDTETSLKEYQLRRSPGRGQGLYNFYRFVTPDISNSILDSLPPGVSYFPSNDNYIEWMSQGLAEQNGTTCSFCFVIDNYFTELQQDSISLFLEQWRNSQPSYAVLFVLSSEAFINPFPYQSIFNQIEETSYSYYLIPQAWRYEVHNDILTYGEGTQSYRTNDWWYDVYVDQAKIAAAIREMRLAGNRNNIRIYKPSEGLLAIIKNALKFLVPDTPPFDQWIPDNLFDVKHIDEYSNEPIEIEISCECPPGCCKICSSKFPGFCCVKYVKG